MTRFHILFFIASQLLASSVSVGAPIHSFARPMLIMLPSSLAPLPQVVDGQCFSDTDCSCGEGTNLCQDQLGNQAPSEGSLACSESAECFCLLSDRRSPSYQGCLRIDGTLSPTTSSPISSAPTSPFPTYEPTTAFPSSSVSSRRL